MNDNKPTSPEWSEIVKDTKKLFKSLTAGANVLIAEVLKRVPKSEDKPAVPPIKPAEPYRKEVKDPVKEAIKEAAKDAPSPVNEKYSITPPPVVEPPPVEPPVSPKNESDIKK